jgi:hypothetical protein
VGRREFKTKCRAHVCGRYAVPNRPTGRGDVRPPTNRPHRVRCHFLVIARAHHPRPARSGTSRCGIFHALRGLAATINVYCSHVSAHPMPDDLAELISQAWAQFDCNHAVFGPENVSTRVEEHAERLTAQNWKKFAVGWHRTQRLRLRSKLSSKLTTAWTPKIWRRLDAMIAPFTTDQFDGPSKLPLPNR